MTHDALSLPPPLSLPLRLCRRRRPHICRSHQLATALFFAIPVVTALLISVVFATALFCCRPILPPPHLSPPYFDTASFCHSLFAATVVLPSLLAFDCHIAPGSSAMHRGRL
jgi:hypothetical protein